MADTDVEGNWAERDKLKVERDRLQLEFNKLAFDRLKFDAEAEKRAQDTRKLRAETLKARLEAREILAPFWKRPAWVAPLVQGLVVVIAVGSAFYSLSLNRAIFEAEQAKTARDKAVGEKDAADKAKKAAEQKETDANLKLAQVTTQIEAKNAELGEASYRAAVAPVEGILDDLGEDGTSLKDDQEKRLLADLLPSDPDSEIRKKFLREYALRTEFPISRRLAALRALFDDERSRHLKDSLSAAAEIKNQFIDIATALPTEGPARTNTWLTLLDFEGEAAAPHICEEYRALRARDSHTPRPATISGREPDDLSEGTFQMAAFIHWRLPSDPSCVDVMWDLIDPVMEVAIFQAKAAGYGHYYVDQWRIPDEVGLARFYDKGSVMSANKGISVAVRNGEFKMEFRGLNARVSYGSPYSGRPLVHEPPSKSEIDEEILTEVSDTERVSKISAWVKTNQELIALFTERGLLKLRRCDRKILEMLDRSYYVGPSEIGQNCPAGTLGPTAPIYNRTRP